MKLFIFVLYGVLVQNITAQAISYAPRNGIPGETIINNQHQHLVANNNPMGAIQTNALSRNMQNMHNGISNIANAMPYTANMANAQMAVNEHPMIGANKELVNANLADIGNANLANGLANSNLATLAGANLASINGNMATFNLGNGGFTVTSGSPSSPGFGIQVLADALEVGGTVAVNGQIPIFGAVTLNGQLPTDGSAAVSYTCGGPTALGGA